MNPLRQAFAVGYESLSAWADLLDRINVFPVADGDTGANLRISLAPLRDATAEPERTRELLARCAIGNSGNIAAAFLQEFYRTEKLEDLAENAERGREKAWQALLNPQAGTMLLVFDRLAATLAEQTGPPPDYYPRLCRELQEAVLATTRMLPALEQAGVVDSGALGIYIFLEGFFRHLSGPQAGPTPIPKLFAGRLQISADYNFNLQAPGNFFCVNARIATGNRPAVTGSELAKWGESVVMLPDESGVKLHIHTTDRQQLRSKLADLGEIVAWSDEIVTSEGPGDFADSQQRPAIHIMTDGAGSITRELARRHGITLLESYIVAQGQSRPESLYSPAELYTLMRAGVKVSTAQASTFERHQHYRSVCQQFGRTLYLCVGSAYTGNYGIARRWQEQNDSEQLLEIVDSGAASGRLALIALLTARYAAQAPTPEAVISFTRKIIPACAEYVFIDELRYLVAGGRASRAGGFFADLLHLKPVITPLSTGVRKLGLVRSRAGQLAFALERLRRQELKAPLIMLQYTDNEGWLQESVLPRVRELLPAAEILLTPLSLTSGVHMGPGTWSLALVENLS